ncbi:MAG: hypothetical protein K8I03_12295 [Ignavibacteria bacterium]|nr:hypothetical protein [Ignavibacteria bacterium]
MKKLILLTLVIFLGCSKQEKTENNSVDSVKKSDSTKENISQTTQSTSSPTKDSVPVPKQTDEEIIREATNGVYTKKSGFIAEDYGKQDYSAEVIDLNEDGQKEVFIELSGGGWPKGFYTLYIKKDGKWYKEFECMGSYSIRSERTNGYLDLSLNAAVGNDKSRAKWNGKRYVDERGKKPCDF